MQNWSDLWLRVVAAVVMALAVGCGSGGSADDSADDGDDTVADDAPDDAGDDGGDDAPVDAVPLDPTPFCTWSCSTPADCAHGEPGTIADVDNYDCVDGVCKSLGCNSAAECIETFDNPNYACATAFGTLTPICWQTCDVAADCVYTTDNALFDVDNYACSDGMCNWTGCNSNAECAAALPSFPQCIMGPYWRVPSCVGACDVAADCASPDPAFDADNYACEDGGCIYQGCNTTAECLASDPDSVCAAYPSATASN